MAQSPSEGGMWYDEYIERVEGVQGGHPVVCGTRTPVRTIATLFHVTYPNDLDEVQRALPHLTARQIEAALAYYHDHRAEIDADIERHDKVLRDFSFVSHQASAQTPLIGRR